MSRRLALPAAALAAGLLLSGCSASAGGIGAGTATALQQEVRHIADLAARHRYPAALAAAGALRSDLAAAVATGRVPADRASRIRATLALVEGDLRTAQAAAKPAPAATATATSTSTPTATPTTAGTPSVVPTRTAKKTADAVQKAIDAARKAAEEQPQKWWHGKGRHKKGDD